MTTTGSTMPPAGPAGRPWRGLKVVAGTCAAGALILALAGPGWAAPDGGEHRASAVSDVRTAAASSSAEASAPTGRAALVGDDTLNVGGAGSTGPAGRQRPRHRRRHGPPAPGGPGTVPPLGPPTGHSVLLFDDAFDGTALDRGHWNTFITSKAADGSPWNAGGAGGSGIDPGGYDAEYFEPSHVSVDHGLTITATRGSTRAGYSWTSGVVSTYGKFQFDGGYVQIEAKMPAGDGLWPGLWLLPGPGGSGGDNDELDMFEGNYLAPGADPADDAAWHLHTPAGTVGGVTDTGRDLTAGYHVYGVDWIPGQSVTWYVDGDQIGRITSASVPVPAEPMELILDLQVADGAAAGWITTEDAATPSPSTMEVARVQVYR